MEGHQLIRVDSQLTSHKRNVLVLAEGRWCLGVGRVFIKGGWVVVVVVLAEGGWCLGVGRVFIKGGWVVVVLVLAEGGWCLGVGRVFVKGGWVCGVSVGRGRVLAECL
ncbi:hypothetical protein Pcinc_040781 [Petrolisthes cinctipes]|uniref:Uncharacterized protein n=1 Tax=Petrolisthes cinctipes TaxID=88211 RepID=A0AAE1BPM1_PETCI|nr:hypothetical protein Pcinc_040781 [Petrolisthes cinctipes]